MLSVSPHVHELVPDDCTLQRRTAYAEDSLIEDAHRGNTLMQRMRRKVAAIQLDLG
jgi:hypothetical protein